jgi:L-aspartate oxidase
VSLYSTNTSLQPKIFDFLVIGGGIAGLTFALEVAKHGTVGVLFKRNLVDSSTAWAQGGIAAVATKDDSPELHIQDTLRAGAGICNEVIVRLVCTEGPERIVELINHGVEFDKGNDNLNYHLNQEGGHSKRRIFHAADATGAEIQKKLLNACIENSNITLFNDACAIDLITNTKVAKDRSLTPSIIGAYVLTGIQKVETFIAQKVLVATGGAGKVYLYTSNPDVATGDGIAMCYRAGCKIANMEFFQFHPTCLFNEKAKSFLISEAMRGEGAILKTISGNRFMSQYDIRAELASRDIVARAIDHEMKLSGDDYVLLDITHREPEFIKQHFPNIYQTCLKFGIDITTNPIPVVPAAHFCCGGVVTDSNGRTNIENLYAAGECAYSGLHGANRLASNSLLEGVVFGYRSAVDALATFDRDFKPIIPPSWNASGLTDSNEQVVITQNWDEIRRFMWNYVGIVRSDKRLARAKRRCELIQKEIEEYYWNFHVTPDLLDLRNINLVAQLIIECASKRAESRGLHYTVDHPKTNPELNQPTLIQKESKK